MAKDSTTLKWYKRKRYIIPLSLFGLIIAIGLASDPGSNYVPNALPTQSQVKDTVTIPARLQPLEIKQAQPDTETPQQIIKPTESVQQTPSYYINSQGNTVQSPTKYNSVPAGASARCQDGTYSFSQSRRGTCSHHGGVSEWF